MEVKENRVLAATGELVIRYVFFPCPHDPVCRRCYLDDLGNFSRCDTHRRSRSYPEQSLVEEAQALLGVKGR